MRKTLLTLLFAIVVATIAPPASAKRTPPSPPADDRVRVAVVDSGVDPSHPALAARLAAVVDCNGAAGDPRRCVAGGIDDTGHGTHVAGIVARLAPDADLLVVRSLHAECDHECRAIGALDDVVAGVRWATAADADVVNLSIDAGVRLDWRNGALATAIRDAWRSGTVVVASTGNRSEPLADDAIAEVPALFVGALDSAGKPADYQNPPGKARWALLAPGGSAGDCGDGAIESTVPRSLDADGTGCLAGTSMAAAHASGALAVLVDRGLSPGSAVAQLLASAHDLGTRGADATTGAGALDLAAAEADAASATASASPSAGPSELAASGAASTGHDSTAVHALSAAEARLGEWPRMHPIRARALATFTVAVALLLAVRTAASVRPRRPTLAR